MTKRDHIRRWLALTLAAALGLLRWGAALADGARTFTAMDTVMTVRAEGASDDLLAACEAEAHRLEGLFSVTDPDSEIGRLNRTGQAELSDETTAVLRGALDMAARTGGALDVTLYPVVRAWGFTTGAYRVPSDDEIALALAAVGYEKVSLSPSGATSVPPGTMIDLGAVAKGYASDRLAALLRENGVTSALIDLGGNIGCVGSKPDGSAWRVALRDPLDDSGYIGIVKARDLFVVTSGQYERFFVGEDGTRYGHIFDPRTGRPADGGLQSVTVIGPEGMTCDALSTALFAMGRDKALSWLNEHAEVQALLLDDQGEIWVTRAFGEGFAPAGAYAAAPTHVIH